MDTAKPKMEGFVLIRDRDTGEVLVDKKNAINYGNMSQALGWGLANDPRGHIYAMVFGNGASTVSGTGAITYFPPNVNDSAAQLYNQTYSKIVDATSPLMAASDRATNNITVQHTDNALYTDIIVLCTLNYGEPAGQMAFDTDTSVTDTYIFDELGLQAFDATAGAGALLTHVVFHPIQKSLNRVIEIIYTLRIYMA
jgi:hypothetical protein